MKESFENTFSESEKKEQQVEKLNRSMIKYFWQASPLAVSRQNSLHQFLKKTNIFSNFSDREIWILTKYLHKRTFLPHEIIFKEGDIGLGFYLVFNGRVEIFANKVHESGKQKQTKVTELGKYDYLGELSIVESTSRRNATAIAKDTVTLLALFKPDVEELIENDPIVAAKLLQAIGLVIAKRFYAVTSELRLLKEKVSMESK